MAEGECSSKVCSQCWEEKPLSAFHRCPRSLGGVRSKCKECRASYDTARRIANPAKAKAFNAAYRAANAERERRRKLEYRTANLARVRQQEEEYRLANPIVYAVAMSRRRARLRNAAGRGVSVAEWRGVIRDSLGLCVYCNRRPAELTMDHIEPLALGGAHDISNVAAACSSCNNTKNGSHLLVWLARKMSRSIARRAEKQ